MSQQIQVSGTNTGSVDSGNSIFPAIVLLAAAGFAILLRNSFLSGTYESIVHFKFAISSFGALALESIVNDALMSIFFLLVGLEIKREACCGQLSSAQQRTIPFVGAVGGMVLPALIFLGLTWSEPSIQKGWAIPCATDIAFSLAVVNALGKSIPASLKILLTALAIIDDIGAILIIALFYSTGIKIGFLLFSLTLLLILIWNSRRSSAKLYQFLSLGAILWFAILQSGIHSTIAGVLLGMVIPIEAGGKRMLDTLEHAIQPWVNFGILPVFAFFNSGVDLSGLEHFGLLSWAIAIALVLGKPLGVVSFTKVALHFGVAKLPPGISIRQLWGLGFLAGIGFTMSLFVALLAFRGNSDFLAACRLGIIAGSLASAFLAFVVLKWNVPKERTFFR